MPNGLKVTFAGRELEEVTLGLVIPTTLGIFEERGRSQNLPKLTMGTSP